MQCLKYWDILEAPRPLVKYYSFWLSIITKLCYIFYINCLFLLFFHCFDNFYFDTYINKFSKISIYKIILLKFLFLKKNLVQQMFAVLSEFGTAHCINFLYCKKVVLLTNVFKLCTSTVAICWKEANKQGNKLGETLSCPTKRNTTAKIKRKEKKTSWFFFRLL